MRLPDHPTVIRRMLDSRLKQLGRTTPVLAASLGEYTHRCGRRSCRCYHGGPLHASQHVTFKEHGKSRTVYVAKELLPEVRAWIAEHRRLKALLKEIQQLTLALVRGHVRHRKRRAGRP